MAQLPPNPAGLELELELRQLESIPLTQVREGAESLLTMDFSDDLMPVGLDPVEKPTVPKGADELVAYYEKQLAATQLVQHRLQKQFNKITEEKLLLETSLQMQTVALQQQLQIVHEKADRACKQAEHSQQQVQEAHTAIEAIVGSVTQLAEFLDASGATQELTHSFEAVAHSTQRTFQAIAVAQTSAQQALQLQAEVKDACLVSPLLTSASAARTDRTVKDLEEDALRLRHELEDSKKREQALEEEMRAAHVLFTGLEAEVVSLQHDQAQAAAKLQLSQEELVAARAQLLAASRALAEGQSAVNAAGILDEGLSKLDSHLGSIQSFLESLSMPQPPVDTLAAVLLQEQRSAVQSARTIAYPATPALAATLSVASEIGVVASDQEGALAAQVALLTHERDAAREQVDALTVRVLSLEGRVGQTQRDRDVLTQTLAAFKDRLDAATSADPVLSAELVGQLRSAYGALSAPAQNRWVSQQQEPLDSHAGQDGGELPSPSSTVLISSPRPSFSQSFSRAATPPSSTKPQLRSAQSQDCGVAAPLSFDLLASPSQLRHASAGCLTPTPSSAQHQHNAPTPPESQQQVSPAVIGATRQAVAEGSDAETKVNLLQQQKEETAQLLHKLGAEQKALAEQLRALEVAKDALETERGQLLARTAALVRECDLLTHRVSELEAHVDDLELEKAALIDDQARQMSMAAAAGAAGAAAAVAVSALPPAPLLDQSPVQSPAESPGGHVYHDNTGPTETAKVALFALGKRTSDLEAELVEVTAEREAALSRTARLEEEVQVMGGLLRQAVDEREAALQQMGRASRSADGLPAAVIAGRSSGPASLGSPLLAPRPSPSPYVIRRARSTRASDGQPLFADPGDQAFGGAGHARELTRAITSTSIVVQSSQQSFASEAPLLPTRRFTDTSEFQTYLLDPTEPLEELLQPAGMMAGTFTLASPADSGALQGDVRPTPRLLAAIAGGAGRASADDVGQLLVSKALTSAQLEAEIDARLAMMQQAHDAKLSQLRAAHKAEVAQLQASLAAVTAAAPAVTRVSEAGLQESPYEAELLQHIAVLEVQVAEFQEQQRHLAAVHPDHEQQLQAKFESRLAALQSQHEAEVAALRTVRDEELVAVKATLQQLAAGQVAQQQADREEISTLQRQVAELREDAAYQVSRAVEARGDMVQQQQDYQAKAAELEASYRAQLAEALARHELEVSRLKTAHEDELLQLQLALQGSQAELTAQQQSARDEVATLQRQAAELCELAEQSQFRSADLLRDELAQQRDTHQAHAGEREVSHQAQLAELQSEHAGEVSRLRAAHEAQLAQLQATLQELEDEQAAQQAAAREEISALQRQVAGLKEQAAQHQSLIRQVRDEMTRQQEARQASAAELEARLTDLQAHHGSELASMQSLYEVQLSQLRDALERREGAQSVESQATREGIEQLLTELAQQQDAHQARLKELELSHSAQLAVLRAAQDAEVSRLKASYEERLTPLQHKVAELLEAQEAQQRTARYEVAALQRQVAELHAEADQYQARIEELSAELAQREVRATELAALHQQQVSEQQSRHDAEVAMLRSGYEERLVPLRHKIAELLDAQEAQQRTARYEVAALQRQVTDLRTEANRHEAAAEELRSEVAQRQAYATELEASLREQVAKQQLQQEVEVQKLRSTMTDAEATQATELQGARREIAAMQQQLTDLREQAAQHLSRIGSLVPELARAQEAHQASTAGHDAQLAALKATHGAGMSALQAGHDTAVAKLLETHDDQLSQLRLTLAVDYQAMLSAQQQAASDELAVMQHQLAQLQQQAEQHQARIAELLADLAQEQGQHASHVAELEEAHRVGLLEQQERHDLAVSQLQGELRSLEDGLQQRMTELVELGAELQQRGTRIADLRIEAERREGLASELRVELQQSQAQLGEVRFREEQQQLQIAELRAASKQHEQHMTGLHAEAEQLQAQLDDMRIQLEQQRVAVEAARADAEKRQAEIGHLRSELQLREGSVADLAAEVEQRDSALSELRTKLQQRDAEVAELRSDLQRCQGAIVELRVQAERHEALVAELRMQLYQRETETAEARSEDERQAALVLDLRAQAQQHQAQLPTLQAELLQRDDAIAKLHAQLGQQEGSLVAAREEVEKLEAHARELRSELQGCEGINAYLHAEAEQLQSLVSGLRAEAEEHKCAAAGLSADLEQCEAVITGLQAEVQQAELQVSGARSEASQLEVQACELRFELQQREDMIANLRAEAGQRESFISELHAEAEERERATAGLPIELEQQATAIVILRSELQQREALLAQARTEAAQREVVIAGIAAELQQHEALLSEVRAEMQQHDVQNGQLRTEAGQCEGVIAELRAGIQHCETLLAEARAGAEERDGTITTLRNELKRREDEINDLHSKLQQLTADREVEEHSLQSLSRTKAWMTEEIRSLQAELKEAKGKLAVAEAGAVQTAKRKTQAPALPSGPAATDNTLGMSDACRNADLLMLLAADQLAVAAMQAAVAEVQLEIRQSHVAASNGGTNSGLPLAAAVARHVASGIMAVSSSAADHMDMMMETVALHGELDEVKAKHRSLQAQLEAMADELAYAVMRASLAEEELEQLRVLWCSTSTDARTPSVKHQAPPVAAPCAAIGTAAADHMDMMMETVALHGELDEVKAKHRALQAAQDAAADDLAYAVLCASLAEEQLEQLRTIRAASNLQSSGDCVVNSINLRSSSSLFSGALRDDGGDDQPPPDHLGTRAVSPLQQTRHLHHELEAVMNGLRELFSSGGAAAQPPTINRQALSSLWPSITAAVHIAGNVLSSLEQQQKAAARKSLSAAATVAADAALRDQQDQHQSSDLNSEVGKHQPQGDKDRARAAYREALEVFEILRVDAEELNGWLWCWASRLSDQVTMLERELARVQATPVPGAQLAWHDAKEQRDAYCCSVEGQLAELQAGLQAAHARLLRRDGQVAALQILLLQLSEQVNVFEGVVVRCEVLSADLVSKSAGAGVA